MGRIKLSKEKIIEAYLKESFSKSPAGTSLSDIATAVGAKKSSLYNHYSSREEIIADSVKFCGECLEKLSIYELLKPNEILELKNKEYLEKFSIELFKTFDDIKNLEILSFIESEKFFDDDAFKISQLFKIRLIKLINPFLKEKTEYFVSTICLFLNDYICAKKYAIRGGFEIEFDESKIKNLLKTL